MNQNTWKDFITLFYPDICLTCHKPLVLTEKFICVTCFLNLTLIQRETAGENDLLYKFAAFPQVKKARSFMAFQRNGAIQQLVHAFKYENHQELAIYLGSLMGSEAKDFFKDADAILPVPLHKSRLKERGYNQSLLLATGFSEAVNIEVVDNQIERIKKTVTQTGKDRATRWKSTREIYSVCSEFQLKGKHVILIDDVVTTGATLSGIIELLIEREIGEISVVSLASER